ncbi:hypothetical protein [Nitrobacter winogradskyi]|uniref:Uncharacterized protein n=2 Tax=Nitrobacter winogradskyi TaxID=913 RepID=A0ACC6AIV0_NITWI|nr:hypothetical protein [Nitrobacter winogradskyi]MCP1999536.1 hypothetical protein [Nitrobacter winogradskyi]GEC16876.1 hypothetical protein NWI01_27680 [Nitrobacter winogradskyi]
MKRYLGVSLAAAIIAFCGVAFVESAKAVPRAVTVAAQPGMLIEVGAARRAHPHRAGRGYRHQRARVYVRGPYQPYYGRPSYYAPGKVTPFFPFGFGYGLDPSW